MRNLLPPELFDIIRDRYIAGVAMAEELFDQSRADEDSLTGALGQAIAMKELLFTGPDGTYSVQISYEKLRGRGPNAPERLYGADGIFQISVTDDAGKILLQKALPFQSKTNWRGRSAKVASQAGDIQSSIGGGVIVDYSKNGYRACPTSIVVELNGDRVKANLLKAVKPLGHILGVEFLECRLGHKGLFYDRAQERFTKSGAIVSPLHAITTTIQRRRAP